MFLPIAPSLALGSTKCRVVSLCSLQPHTCLALSLAVTARMTRTLYTAYPESLGF